MYQIFKVYKKNSSKIAFYSLDKKNCFRVVTNEEIFYNRKL